MVADWLMRAASQLALMIEPDLGVRGLEQLEFELPLGCQMQPGDLILPQGDGLTLDLAVAFPSEHATKDLAQFRADPLARRVIRLVGVRPANELDVKSHLLRLASPESGDARERQHEQPEEFR